MNILDWLFRKNWVECPRCLGKGHVDLRDIERLHKELFWMAGKCAYCKGRGHVPPDMPDKVKPDLAYLSLSLRVWERRRLINGDQAALNRAREFELNYQRLVASIRQLYLNGKREPVDIARHLYLENGKTNYSAADLQQSVQYIEKVIKYT